jgi:hypothetical protein
MGIVPKPKISFLNETAVVVQSAQKHTGSDLFCLQNGNSVMGFALWWNLAAFWKVCLSWR